MKFLGLIEHDLDVVNKEYVDGNLKQCVKNNLVDEERPLLRGLFYEPKQSTVFCVGFLKEGLKKGEKVTISYGGKFKNSDNFYSFAIWCSSKELFDFESGDYITTQDELNQIKWKNLESGNFNVFFQDFQYMPGQFVASGEEEHQALIKSKASFTFTVPEEYNGRKLPIYVGLKGSMQNNFTLDKLKIEYGESASENSVRYGDLDSLKFDLIDAFNTAMSKKVDKASIVNNLEDGGANKVLSAEQGKILFQSVSNGKQLIASAITDKGIQTEVMSEFSVMADNIRNISGGMTNEDKANINKLGQELEKMFVVCNSIDINSFKDLGISFEKDGEDYNLENLLKILNLILTGLTNVNQITIKMFDKIDTLIEKGQHG